MTPRLQGRSPTAGTIGSAAVALPACLALVGMSAVGCSADGGTPPDAVGPADAYLDAVLGVGEDGVARQDRAMQESIAACMAEAGFEYRLDLGSLMAVEIDDAGSRERAAEWGWGLTTHDPASTTVTTPADDPNAELLATMSPAEVQAWDEALFGDMAEVSGDGEDWAAHAGCAGRAHLELQAAGGRADPTYEALAAEIERIDAEVVPNDPAVAAADAEYAGCMADAGFPGLTDGRGAWEWWFAEVQARESELAGGGPGIDAALLDAAYLEWADEERALAVADWDCRDEIGYDAVVARVRNAAQAEYVEAHRDELDAWAEQYGSGS